MKRSLAPIDALVLVALMAYVLAGVAITPFHGDEPMHIYSSRDYETVFVERRPSALMTEAPYVYDSDAHLRLLNGSVTRYLIGLARRVAGVAPEQLPAAPGWDWGLDYQHNVETGRLPSESLLLIGRLPSALLLAISVPLMFALGRLFGGRGTAHLAAAIYALNPVVLLNGRRALQEGALLFFGLLVVLIGAAIARRRRESRPVRLLWMALAGAGALALASKHNALPFVLGALAWVFLAELTRLQMRPFLATTGALCVCAVVMVAGFVALSPALWRDPPARLGNLVVARSELMDLQLGLSPGGATTMGQRANGIVTQPFARPPQFYELGAWAGYEPITQQIRRYVASPLGGYPTGGVLGALLTAAALLGAATLLVPRRRPDRDLGTALGLLAWTGAMCAALLVNPLAWQRYALGLVPEAALLAAIGCAALGALLVPRPAEPSGGAP